MDTRSLGAAAEEQAVSFLEKVGWKILGRNQHFRFGEVDILADSGDYIVVVEVKAKKNSEFGTAAEMLTPAKRKTLVKLAKWLEPEYNKPVRIDVITIDHYAERGGEIVHYPFAVEE